jgi:CRP/FNR family transcriptional regulator
MNEKPKLQRCPDPQPKCKECPIRNMTLFRDVPEDDLGWMQEFRDSQYLLPAGEILYRQGETAHTLYTLFDGWLILFKTLDNGNRQILRFLLPGDFFGFQVDGIGPAAGYMHGSQALMESTLCAFPVTRFRSMMQKQPRLTTRLAEMEMHDMNLCQNHLIDTARNNARQHIAFLLLELFHRARRQIQNGYDGKTNSIVFPLTPEDIGDAIGLTSDHVNSILQEMEGEGLIRCQKKRLSILNEEALMEIGEFDPGMILPKHLI